MRTKMNVCLSPLPHARSKAALLRSYNRPEVSYQNVPKVLLLIRRCMTLLKTFSFLHNERLGCEKSCISS